MSDPQHSVATALRDARLVDEVHAFLWTDQFANRGALDDGWSSRGHAVVVGQLLSSLGADVSIRHGKCMFVQEPGSDGASSVGIGQEADSKDRHTWLAVRPTLFAMTATHREYGAEITRASGATDRLQAVYLLQREEPFTGDIAQAGLSWANSRVSLRLLERGLPDDLYVRFASHLLGLLCGERRPLRGLSRNRAWSVLAEDRHLAGHYPR